MRVINTLILSAVSKALSADMLLVTKATFSSPTRLPSGARSDDLWMLATADYRRVGR